MAFSHGMKEEFAMAARTISTGRRNLISISGAIVALAGMVVSSQAGRAYWTPAQEAHARQISAWCYYNFGLTTASLEGQDCFRRAWVQIPDTDCQPLYGNNSCTAEFEYFYGRAFYGTPYVTRRPIEK
jgi:hypothetical protein